MNSQPKKIVSVTFAVIFGIGIIFVAWRSSVPTSDPSLVKTAGTNDTLGVVPSKYSYATLGFNSGKPGANDTATTTTDFIAEQLALNYVLAQQNTATTTLVNPDPEALTQDLAKKALSDPLMKHYTETDLNIKGDSSYASIDIYKKQIAGAFVTLSKENKVNELLAIADALDSKDSSKLAPLDIAATADQKFLQTILAIQVPPSVVPVHLLLVQGYSYMLSGINDIKQIITDPIRGMRGLSKYEYGLNILSQVPAAIIKK